MGTFYSHCLLVLIILALKDLLAVIECKTVACQAVLVHWQHKVSLAQNHPCTWVCISYINEYNVDVMTWLCRPVLLMGALRGERPAGPLAVMALVEAIAAVVCEPGLHTTDPIILSATLQAGPISLTAEAACSKHLSIMY